MQQQGLKPKSATACSARLKSCPDTNRLSVVGSTAWTPYWSSLKMNISSGTGLGLADNPPDVFGFNGHVEMANAIRRERIHHSGNNRRSRADSSGFAHAFHAHGIHVRGCFGAVQFHPGNVGGAGHSVIHQRAAHELSLIVIDD